MKNSAARKSLIRAARVVTVALLAAGLVSCAPPEGAEGTADGDARTATSAADFGGMEGLIEAAKAEGELNVIALPPDWANYGAIIAKFSEKYGIKVNSAQPGASSQEEINAAVQQKGRSTAPDVFDLGQSVALANTEMFAPYKVEHFAEISDSFKHPDGLWVNDYGGYMSIGYDSTKVPTIAGVDDLLKPEFAGKVALNGDPTQSGSAFSGVMMVAIARGGSPDDIAPGVDFFAQLADAGNFLPVDPTPATIASGQTPVVLDWDYLNVEQSKKVPGWKVIIPHNAAVAGYYFQAINADAPHPAAARLWQEFLYSDEGQNLYLGGGARPVRADSMVTKGSIDRVVYGGLPPVDGAATFVTVEQNEAATEYLETNWAKAIG